MRVAAKNVLTLRLGCDGCNAETGSFWRLVVPFTLSLCWRRGSLVTAERRGRRD